MLKVLLLILAWLGGQPVSDDIQTEKIVLNSDEAIVLWLKGKKVWNSWVEQHPVADIDFSGVDLAQYRIQQADGCISFHDYTFPEGHVDFSRVSFGDGDVDFSSVRFGNGVVDFSSVSFGDGDVNFSSVSFGDGHVDFSRVSFGDGDVDFSSVSFGDGDVSFQGSSFGEGCISFYKVKFGDGNIAFWHAYFGTGTVLFDQAIFDSENADFSNAKFGDGDIFFRSVFFRSVNVKFRQTAFGDGDVSFQNTEFVKGSVDFREAIFGSGNIDFQSVRFEGDIIDFRETDFGPGNICFNDTDFVGEDITFIEAKFGEGDVSFQHASFKGRLFFENIKGEKSHVTFKDAVFDKTVSFSGVFSKDGEYYFEKMDFNDRVFLSEIKTTEVVNKMSFRYSNFEKSLDLTGSFACVVDLTNTKISNQVTVHGLECKLKRSNGDWRCLWQKKAMDPEDSARLRRLKELAEIGKDHERALAFHADEMRARRWNEIGIGASLLDMLFSGFSNYGRSIMRPTIGLLATIMVMTVTCAQPEFEKLISKDWQAVLISSKWGNALELSLSNSLPFIASARQVRTSSIKVLFSSPPDVPSIAQHALPWWFNMASIIQGILTFIFLFLIGLALRNRFRI